MTKQQRAIIAACKELLAHYQAKCRGIKTRPMACCPLCRALESAVCTPCPWIAIEGLPDVFSPCIDFFNSTVKTDKTQLGDVRCYNSSRKWARIRVRQLKRWIAILEAKK